MNSLEKKGFWFADYSFPLFVGLMAAGVFGGTHMYYIYHIEGVKIGCTNDVERRINQQGFTSCEVLEEHFDIFKASNREIELQKKYGYRVDSIPYFKSVKQWGATAGTIGGKQTAINNKKLGLEEQNRITPEKSDEEELYRNQEYNFIINSSSDDEESELKLKKIPIDDSKIELDNLEKLPLSSIINFYDK